MSSDSSPVVEEILNRIKSAYDLKSDAELARFLGVGASTPGNWRLRGSINYDVIFSKCGDLNLNWLLRGEGIPRPPRRYANRSGVSYVEEKKMQPKGEGFTLTLHHDGEPLATFRLVGVDLIGGEGALGAALREKL